MGCLSFLRLTMDAHGICKLKQRRIKFFEDWGKLNLKWSGEKRRVSKICSCFHTYHTYLRCPQKGLLSHAGLDHYRVTRNSWWITVEIFWFVDFTVAWADRWCVKPRCPVKWVRWCERTNEEHRYFFTPQLHENTTIVFDQSGTRKDTII